MPNTSTHPKAVVIYSGGMDSFTLLHDIQQNYSVFALSFDYGQRHRKNELLCAQSVCHDDQINHKLVDIQSIGSLFSQDSSLMNTDIPLPSGHYNADNRTTVVPNRNMVFLSIAIAYALSLKAGTVFYGAHQDDDLMYPDCRPEFIKAMDHAAHLCDWNNINIQAPYLLKSKSEILKIGLSMGLNYAKTWTCYDNNDKACGQCSACIVRLDAFKKNNITDPISYL